MAKYIQIIILIASSLLAGLRAEAQTTDAGVTILAPPTDGIRIGPGLEIILPPTRTPPVVAPPPTGVPAPMPVALQPPTPPTPPSARPVTVLALPVLRAVRPVPQPVVAPTTMAQRPAPLPPQDAPSVVRPFVPELQILAQHETDPFRSGVFFIPHLWTGTVWVSQTGVARDGIAVFTQNAEIPRGEDRTVRLHVSDERTSEFYAHVMCGGTDGVGGVMLRPVRVQTGRTWHPPFEECLDALATRDRRRLAAGR